MRVELPRPIFKAAIERLSVLSESGKLKVDAYTNLRLETLEGGLLFSAFNRSMRAEIKVTEVLHSGGHLVCGIPLQSMKELCATLPEAESVGLDFEEGTCTIRCGAVRFRTKLLLEDAFPKPQPETGELRPVNLGFLLHAMSLVQYCANTASQRQYAHGLIVTKTSICATDGFRLAKVPDEWLKPEAPIALTLDTVTKLQKLFKGYPEGAVLLRDGELLMTGGGIKAVTRLAAWKIPRVEEVLPKDKVPGILIEKEGLVRALERALIVANERIPRTTLHFEAGEGIRIYTEEDGQAADDIIAAPVPRDGSVQVDPKYLLDAVEAVESDTIQLELRGPQDPLIITDEKGNHVNVVMPILSTDR